MMRIDQFSFDPTDMAELETWLDSLDMADGWNRSREVTTGKGVYIVTVEPKMLNGIPIRFDRNEAAE